MILDSHDIFNFGVIGPGQRTVEWARFLERIGAEAWVYTPNSLDKKQIEAYTNNISVEESKPYMYDGSTQVLIAAGEWSEERDDLILEALSNGLHVICEPPLAITLEDAQDFKKAAVKNDVSLMTMFRGVHSAVYRNLRQGITEIGNIYNIDVLWTDTSLELDPLWDIMVEPMALVYGLTKNLGVTFQPQHGPGFVRVDFETEDMGDITIKAMSSVVSPEHRVNIIGADGAIECHIKEEDCKIRNYGGETERCLGTGLGPMHHAFIYFCDNAKNNNEKIPQGEIGIAVTSFLSQMDKVLT